LLALGDGTLVALHAGMVSRSPLVVSVSDTLPLTISGHQRPAPSFVEAPSVVAIDDGVHR
jgi:hypothetical protein